MKYTLYLRHIPLKTPFKTALRTVEQVEDVVLKIEEDGIVGYGSCSPTKAITGDDLERIIMLSKAGTTGRQQSSSVRYMFDTAFMDYEAKKQGVSVASLLCGSSYKKKLISDITISRNGPEEMMRDAKKAVDQGFHYLKLKVGGTFQEDKDRLDAVVSVLKDGILIRIDANQAWDAETAIRIIRSYEKEGYPIDLIEQPVPHDDLDGMAKVCKNVGYPIMADESVFDSRDVQKVLAKKAAGIINIKLAKCGGIAEAKRMCRLAEQSGVPCMMGCMMEGPIGLLSAVHLAASFPIITRYDLDCPMLFASLPGVYDTLFDDEVITLGEAPGLGILDDGLEGADEIWTAED